MNSDSIIDLLNNVYGKDMWIFQISPFDDCYEFIVTKQESHHISRATHRFSKKIVINWEASDWIENLITKLRPPKPQTELEWITWFSGERL